MPQDIVNWIEDLLLSATEKTKEEFKKNKNHYEFQLIHLLIDECYRIAKENSSLKIGHLLAGSFDLLVSADYYTFIGHKGWLYCSSPEPRLYYHFTNCCPRHALLNEFFFNPSSKPGSGNIGKSTSRLLRSFLNSLLKHNKCQEEVLKGVEPVDLVVVNREQHKILFGEIKASPLLTLPISIVTEKLTTVIDGDFVEDDHSSTDLTNLFHSDLFLFVPKKLSQGWTPIYYPIGRRSSKEDYFWGYQGIINLINQDKTFLPTYFAFWDAALTCYYPKNQKSIYWLTNACGSPAPKPASWPKAKGGDGDGYETISDSKTSVGMDRTDDIKKGIYQVLKLGSEGKPVQSKWDFKVGIVSNIHPARHFEEYLQSLKDLVWTKDETGKAKRIGDLPDEQELYNLFDGVIALTESYYRDEWLKQVFTTILEVK
jgi:hypothetical protein